MYIAYMKVIFDQLVLQKANSFRFRDEYVTIMDWPKDIITQDN